jgi:16S rRNA (adenine(1408)-N(1))-methyltransferase
LQEQILGKKSEQISREKTLSFLEDYHDIHIDLGTGDGLFAWRLAKEFPQKAVIGIDAAKDSLKEASSRAVKKPSRGGTPNAIFLCDNVLEMDNTFEGLADCVSVNFPWGSLLQAVIIPFPEFVSKMASLLKMGGELHQHINMHVFNDDEQRKNLGLPLVDDVYLQEKLIPIYADVGLELIEYFFIPAGEKTEVASTWGGRLTRNSSRPTLVFKCKKVGI